MTASQRDIKDFLKFVAAGQLDATAGGTGDATEEDGEWVDARGYQSAVLVVGVRADLQEGETVTVIGNAQTCSDGAGAGVADYGDAATSLVLTGGSGGTTEFGVLKIPLNLNHSEFLGWIRAQFTMTHSATGTDISRGNVVAVLGGADEKPAA